MATQIDPSLQPGSPRRSSGGMIAWFLLVLVLIAAGAGAYFGLELYRHKDEDFTRAQQANSDLTARIRELDEGKKALEDKLRRVEEEAQALAAARTALEADLAEKDAKIAALQATYQDLDSKMKKEIASGEIRLSQAGGRIQVDLVDKILFESGEANLSSRGQEVLTRLGASLAEISDRQIQVSGHTDDTPIRDKLLETYATNWELSSARAVNVVRFLSENAKVPPGRLVAAGHGPHRPIASNATPQGRARNRRIEILLLPEIATPKTKAVAKGK